MEARDYEINAYLRECEYQNDLQQALVSEAQETIENFTIEKSIGTLTNILDGRIEANDFIVENVPLQDWETQLNDWLTWEELQNAGVLEQFKRYILEHL